MNKRQRKKLLYKAIREVYNSYAINFNKPLLTDADVLKIYKLVKDNRYTVNNSISLHNDRMKVNAAFKRYINRLTK